MLGRVGGGGGLGERVVCPTGQHEQLDRAGSDRDPELYHQWEAATHDPQADWATGETEVSLYISEEEENNSGQKPPIKPKRQEDPKPRKPDKKRK